MQESKLVLILPVCLSVCLSVSLHEWVYSVVTQIQLLYSVACYCISQSSQQPWSGADAGMKGASDGNPEPSKIPHLSGLERALHASATATNSTFSMFKDSHQLGLEIALHALTPATNSAFPMFTPPVPLLLFVYLVFTCMPGESYHRWLRSLLCLCDSFWALINSLICWFYTSIQILPSQLLQLHF